MQIAEDFSYSQGFGAVNLPIEHPIVAILGGTGKEGTGLALRWAKAGYKILIGSRQLDKAKLAADRINHQLAISSVIGLTNPDAAKQAELCVLTVIYSAHRQALESVRDVLHGKILVDTTSRVDFRDPRPPVPPCAAQEAQDILGQSVRVVAAFQNIPANLLIRNIGQAIEADVMVCSDDFPAAQQVILLARAAGMRGYYAGVLENAIVVEDLTSLLISLNKHYGVKNASIRVVGVPGER